MYYGIIEWERQSKDKIDEIYPNWKDCKLKGFIGLNGFK